MDLNISEVSNEHKLFQGWGFDHVHFYGKHFHFLLTFPLLNSESFALFEKEEPNFHICCRKQQRKGKKKLWKKEFVFVKNSSQSFFPSTLFSVFKTNSIKIFEIFLKNKPVSNDIYNEVVELNPSLLYTVEPGYRRNLHCKYVEGLCRKFCVKKNIHSRVSPSRCLGFIPR